MDHRDSDMEGSMMVARLAADRVGSPFHIASRNLQLPFQSASDTDKYFDKSGGDVSEPEEDVGPPLRGHDPPPALIPTIKQERGDEVKVGGGVVGWGGGGVYLSTTSSSVPLSGNQLVNTTTASSQPPPQQTLTGGVVVPQTVTSVHHSAIQQHHHQTGQLQPSAVPLQSSASSHSSESSTSSHHAWSFEEQFKQLYELSDDPKRKEFLDDLFSFMQRRGTPINRLPIMAKSVLDLFELYNLVIQRGGLVDVINKKLWQEIIKGLHLPSSITSAAFTLRTQYMKYLYPYECEKRRLSTPGELQAAIDGNRREGRRGSYGTYAEMMQRSPGSQQLSPLSLVHRPGSATGSVPPPASSAAAVAAAAAAAAALNGNHHHLNNNHLPPLNQPPLIPPPVSGSTNLAPTDFEARMMDYVKLLNNVTTASQRQNSPPVSPPESGPFNTLDMSRFSLWNLYHGGATSVPSPEPQKEALNLEKRTDSTPVSHLKRHHPDQDDISVSGAHIKISSRGKGDGRGTSDNSLVVSMDINGTMYQGVLFAQTSRSNRLQS